MRAEPVGPVPPERYRITYTVPSLRLTQQGEVVRVERTSVDMFLPAAYPRAKPYFTTTEPVFHPNFGPHVCIGDEWTPGHSLVELVVEIAELLQYRRYSTKTPINEVAARWAHQNAALFPLGSTTLTPLPADMPTAETGADPVPLSQPGEMTS